VGSLFARDRIGRGIIAASLVTLLLPGCAWVHRIFSRSPEAGTATSGISSIGKVDADDSGKKAGALDYKMFRDWKPRELNAADCRSQLAERPVLILYSDGRLHWKALVSVRDTHDTWQGDFIFMDSAGNIIGASRRWSYSREDSNPPIYTWDQTREPDATLERNFNNIVSVSFHYSC
jgi:hypothetical protein